MTTQNHILEVSKRLFGRGCRVWGLLRKRTRNSPQRGGRMVGGGGAGGGEGLVVVQRVLAERVRMLIRKRLCGLARMRAPFEFSIRRRSKLTGRRCAREGNSDCRYFGIG